MLIQENKSAIDALNIPENAKFIVAPDPCQNGGLFCLNRMGWTIDSPDKINLQRIINLQEKGAQYLLFSKKDLKYSTIGNQIGDLILNTEEILIYKLR